MWIRLYGIETTVAVSVQMASSWSSNRVTYMKIILASSVPSLSNIDRNQRTTVNTWNRHFFLPSHRISQASGGFANITITWRAGELRCDFDAIVSFQFRNYEKSDISFRVFIFWSTNRVWRIKRNGPNGRQHSVSHSSCCVLSVLSAERWAMSITWGILNDKLGLSAELTEASSDLLIIVHRALPSGKVQRKKNFVHSHM